MVPVCRYAKSFTSTWTHFMRPSSNVTIRGSVENQSSLLGAEIGPLCARPHTKRANSACPRPCPLFEPSAFRKPVTCEGTDLRNDFILGFLREAVLSHSSSQFGF